MTNYKFGIGVLVIHSQPLQPAQKIQRPNFGAIIPQEISFRVLWLIVRGSRGVIELMIDDYRLDHFFFSIACRNPRSPFSIFPASYSGCGCDRIDHGSISKLCSTALAAAMPVVVARSKYRAGAG